jgi:hypothetical protein
VITAATTESRAKWVSGRSFIRASLSAAEDSATPAFILRDREHPISEKQNADGRPFAEG